MDISYCNELVVLADCLSFSQAADRLFITQSTLSKHVATAEKEAGFRIFDRDTSKVELTESGRAYICLLYTSERRSQKNALALSGATRLLCRLLSAREGPQGSFCFSNIREYRTGTNLWIRLITEGEAAGIVQMLE